MMPLAKLNYAPDLDSADSPTRTGNPPRSSDPRAFAVETVRVRAHATSGMRTRCS
jgi:hypothetical protein